MALGIGERIRELREERARISRKALGEAVGFRGDSAYQTVYEWETGRRGVEAAQVRQIARALGVDVADLFNETTETSSYRAQLEDVVAQFRRVLEMRPERIEVNVYARGSDQPAQEHQAEEPTAAPYEGLPADYVPAPSQMFMRRFMEQWREMDEDERQEWLQFAEMVRAEEGKAE